MYNVFTTTSTYTTHIFLLLEYGLSQGQVLKLDKGNPVKQMRQTINHICFLEEMEQANIFSTSYHNPFDEYISSNIMSGVVNKVI